jgi:hypothetical protein
MPLIRLSVRLAWFQKFSISVDVIVAIENIGV